MTDRAGAYHHCIRRFAVLIPPLLAALAASACGSSQKSTLPPSPGRSGTVSLRNLARYPEVYADATVATIGRVATAGDNLYKLTGGGHGTRIVLEPTARVARFRGRSVRVSGLFAVSFQIGYEILVTQITPAARL